MQKLDERLRERLEFLEPGLGLKRWGVLVLLGLLQISFGISLLAGDAARRNKALQGLTLAFLPGPLRGLLFTLAGVALTREGYNRFSRALVRVMLPDRPETNLGQVLVERRRVETGRRVVVIGGDPGITPIIAALQSLKADIRVDVILSATEPGRRAQELQSKYGLTPRQIIFPISDDAVLYAELEDGRLLEGQTTISRFAEGTIKDIFLSRDIRRVQVWEADQNREQAQRLRDYMPNVSEAALTSIREAEIIVIAPGRLYTQLLPNLTLPRLAQAIRESKASKIFVANLMTEPVRTEGWAVANYLETIRKLSGITIDYVVVHQGEISSAMLKQYHNEGAEIVPRAQAEEEMSRLIFADTGQETTLVEGAVVISDNIVTEAPQIVTFQRGEETILREMPVVRHDWQKLAPLLNQLLNDSSL